MNQHPAGQVGAQTLGSSVLLEAQAENYLCLSFYRIASVGNLREFVCLEYIY